MSWHGIRTVATLELRQRVRASRWVWCCPWFGVIGLVSGLSWWALNDPMATRAPRCTTSSSSSCSVSACSSCRR